MDEGEDFEKLKEKGLQYDELLLRWVILGNDEKEILDFSIIHLRVLVDLLKSGGKLLTSDRYMFALIEGDAFARLKQERAGLH
jgi:hypothetical protein